MQPNLEEQLTIIRGAAAACMVIAVVPACTGHLDDQTDVRAIQSANAAWDSAWNAGDAHALAALYLPNAVTMAPNAPGVHGREAIRAWSQLYLEQFREINRTHTEDVRVSGNLAVARGTQETWTYPKVGGDSAYDEAKWVVVYARQADGSWKVLWEIWNSDRPLPGAQAAAQPGPAQTPH